MVELVQYETEDGACPFAEWFDGLDVRAALKVRTALSKLDPMALFYSGTLAPIYTGIDRLHVAKIAKLHSCQRSSNLEGCSDIKTVKPLCKRASTIFGFILDKFYHGCR